MRKEPNPTIDMPPQADATVAWLPLHSGAICLGHRPKRGGMVTLREQGATHVVTLLSEREGARELGRAAVEAGLAWIWLPMPNGNPPPSSDLPRFREAFDAWAPIVREGGRIFVHCAAGIHRTGMVVHAFLQHLGMTAIQARASLASLRTVTEREVGEARLRWGAAFGADAPKPDAEWVPLFRPGPLAGSRKMRIERWNKLFGDSTWQLAFRWADRMVEYRHALQLYEDAYMQHFVDNPAQVEWLCSTARDVYDNDESNVASGLDYAIQETQTTHLQDIAVRRCLLRLGRSFRGKHLVEIRGRESEGYRLNPGCVPFHRPDLVLQPEARAWWAPSSIESFWQSNKIVMAGRSRFSASRRLRVHLVLPGRDDAVAVAATEEALLPVLEYTGDDDFSCALASFLAPWGIDAGCVVPGWLEPEAEGSVLHAAAFATEDCAVPPEGYELRPRSKALGALPPSPARALLRNALRSAERASQLPETDRCP